ncbi:MAG: RNA polymerase sigma factor SigM [Actinomycetota bacterium]|nr:RNA polymerase sigma factor SigM [Actinomycetota bacterium]
MGTDGRDAGGSNADDAALLERHAAGDPDAFAVLVRRHRDRLWAVALRTLGDPDEAADAVQDALVSAFRATAPGSSGAARFRGDAAVTTWLHRVVVNACLDRVRRRAARPAVPLPDNDVGMPPAADRIAPAETSMMVTQALATLPAEQRAALVLVDMGGWSVDAAAAVLGVAPGTVKSRCARGRAKLAPLLAPLRNPDIDGCVQPPATAPAASMAAHDQEGGRRTP